MSDPGKYDGVAAAIRAMGVQMNNGGAFSASGLTGDDYLAASDALVELGARPRPKPSYGDEIVSLNIRLQHIEAMGDAIYFGGRKPSVKIQNRDGSHWLEVEVPASVDGYMMLSRMRDKVIAELTELGCDVGSLHSSWALGAGKQP